MGYELNWNTFLTNLKTKERTERERVRGVLVKHEQQKMKRLLFEQLEHRLYTPEELKQRGESFKWEQEVERLFGTPEYPVIPPVLQL